MKIEERLPFCSTLFLLNLINAHHLWKNEGVAWGSCSSILNENVVSWLLRKEAVNHNCVIYNNYHISETNMAVDIIQMSRFLDEIFFHLDYSHANLRKGLNLWKVKNHHFQ